MNMFTQKNGLEKDIRKNKAEYVMRGENENENEKKRKRNDTQYIEI